MAQIPNVLTTAKAEYVGQPDSIWEVPHIFFANWAKLL